MKQQPTVPRLTPAVYDFYIARARAERAKAIAEFGGHLGAWLRGLAARLARRSRTASTHYCNATAPRPVRHLTRGSLAED